MINSQYKYPIFDLHTDFILAERCLGKKFFGINTSGQINLQTATSSDYKFLMAGFSYDDEKGCTQKMVDETLDFLDNQKPTFKVILHMEGAEILVKNPNLLEQYYSSGLRSIGLAHVSDNSLCGSSSSDKNLGLQKEGKKLLKKLLNMDVAVDLAHMSKKSFYQTLNLIKKPPIVSHTACYKLENNSRNINDDQIRKVARMDGVVGIFFSALYLNSKKPATVLDVAKHIYHISDLVGVSHVAIGSDFGGITKGTPVGLESAVKINNLISELVNMGFDKDDIKKITYQNAYRAISQWTQI